MSRPSSCLASYVFKALLLSIISIRGLGLLFRLSPVAANSAPSPRQGLNGFSARDYGNTAVLDQLDSGDASVARRLAFHRQRRLASRQAANDTTFGGLPANYIPTFYNLTIGPNIDERTFDGRVIIDLDVVHDATEAVFNANPNLLNMTSIVLTIIGKDASSTELQAGNVSFDTVKYRANVTFPGAIIPAGAKAQLAIMYTGLLTDIQSGHASFFSWPYKKVDGTTGYNAATFFEPTGARGAYPCWDEPALKANFSITLIVDRNHTAVSNMDVMSETEVESSPLRAATGPKKVVRFQTSPRMPTYLTAWSVGNLQYLESRDFHSPVRIYGAPSMDLETAKFPIKAATDVLNLFEKAFNFRLELPKVDLMGVVNYGGGMENWGMIVFDEGSLSNDQKSHVNSYDQVKDVQVINHELAHQWFGDLVTTRWWNDVWVQEGIAEYLNFYSMSKLYPHWHPWDDYYINEAEVAMQDDARRGTHPVMLPIGGPYTDMFGSVTYFKGSTVMRMAFNLVTENEFLASLHQYLVTHAYGSGTTADIWSAFNEVTGRDIAEHMGPWVYQPGFPFLNVTETYKANGTMLYIEQHRFLVGGDATAEEDTVLFPVQLSIRTKSGIDYASMLTERVASFPLSSKSDDDDFFILNADHIGFWRANYSPERLKKLAKQATQGLLSVSDRSGLILDTAALAMAGYQKTSSFLVLVDAWKAEESYFVWKVMMDKLTDLTLAWAGDTAVLQKIRAMKLDMLGPLARQLGWTFTAGEDPTEQNLKALAFNVAAVEGELDVVNASHDMFWAYMNGDKTAVPASIIDAVFKATVASGGIDEYNAVLNAYDPSAVLSFRTTIMNGLAAASSPELLTRTMDLLVNNSIPTVDRRFLVVGLAAAGPVQAGATFSTILSNFDTLTEQITLNWAQRFAAWSIAPLWTRQQLDQARAFYTGNRTVSLIDQAIDGVAARLRWSERDSDDVHAWFGL